MKISPVIGLFPCFLDGRPGGVQESGRIAWATLEERCQAERQPSQLVCYGPEPALDVDHARRHCTTKRQAVVRTIRLNVETRALVVVWHLTLLRLLPFLRVKQRRVVLFLHGVEAWTRHGFIERWLLARVDLFLTNSDYTWDRFAGLHSSLRDRPHRTVHLGIGRPAGTHLPTQPAALMLGRLLKSEGYKGHLETIKAWPRVVQAMPEAQLWIAGDGDLRGDLERLVRQCGVASRVRFLGRVSDIEKERLLRECRCLILPSRAEGFGLVYLEAMRLGRPCLVSGLDAGTEVVYPPEAGLAADPSDPEALARAILDLLADDASWYRRSENARRRYEERFTERHFRERLLEALFGEPGV